MLWSSVDRWLGADPRRDIQQALRLRIAFAFSVVLAATSAFNAVILYLNDAARPGMVELGIAGSVVALSTTALLIYTRRPNLVLCLCTFFAILVFAGSAWGNRGAYPPAAAYVPMIILGLYVAWGWRTILIAIPLLIGFFGAVLVFGNEFQDLADRYEQAGSLILLVTAAVLACVWILFFGSIIRSANESAADHLQEQNQALKRLVHEAEAASRVKTEFLANMGHELRTPLNGVLGMTTVLLQEDSLSDAQRDRLNLIHGSGENLLDLLNDVLDLSQAESGVLELDEIAFDLFELSQSVAAGWRETAEAKGLAFALDLPNAGHGLVVGDPIRLRQILNNLLSNAVKFTARGEILLRVVQDEDDHQVITRFSVSDSGIGIAPEKQATVFESFQQVDASVRRRYGGTGLGLAISQQLATMMGGQLSLTSQPGQGSTFTLAITSRLARDEDRKAENAEQAPIAVARPLRMLLVDDVQTNLLVLGALVKQAFDGAAPEIETAASGREAINKASAADYDFILMDIQMPEMDGVTAMRCIREIRRASDTQIIAVTALASEGNRRALSSEGFCDYLPKPVNASALRAVLARNLPASVSVTGSE